MLSSPDFVALRAISSMATKALLATLGAQFQAASGTAVEVLSVGGVDAAKRVQAGESFDAVLLASDAIQRLIDGGHLLADSRCDWVDSPVAVAVAAGAPQPAIASEADLRAAVLAAPTLSYSTGPSGVYLEALFERWGVLEQLRPRIVVPPPGTPVGTLVAQGQAALGFQQLSELMALPGLSLLGCLPAEVAFITTFSAGVPTALAHDASRLARVRTFLQFLASADTLAAKRQHGMDWARAAAPSVQR